MKEISGKISGAEVLVSAIVAVLVVVVVVGACFLCQWIGWIR